MSKLTILAVIAVSVSAQFVSERRPYEGETLRRSSDEPRGNQDFWDDGPRVNQGHMHGSTGDSRAGGFQNGNFAQTDGRLRTNLDNNPTEYSGQNFQPRYDSPYVVEEGAAFRRHDQQQPDVHTSQGRIDEDSFSGSDDRHFEERRQTQSLEQRPRNQNGNEQTSSQGNQRGNEQISSQRNQNANEQSNTRTVNNNQNQDRHSETEGQSYSQQDDQNTGHNHAQLDVRNSNQNTRQTPVRNQPEINQNSRTNSKKNEKPVTHSVTTSTGTGEQVANKQDKETRDKEINNQITKMYFDASVQEPTANTKSHHNNKTEPVKSISGKEDDRWIWNMTSTDVIPSVDDRAAFVADQCPTDMVRINGVCVDKD